MTSIVELFPKARRLAYDLQTQVRQVSDSHGWEWFELRSRILIL